MNDPKNTVVLIKDWQPEGGQRPKEPIPLEQCAIYVENRVDLELYFLAPKPLTEFAKNPIIQSIYSSMTSTWNIGPVTSSRTSESSILGHRWCNTSQTCEISKEKA